VTSPRDGRPATAADDALLARLGEEFFEAVQEADPLTATQLGVPGFDALLPDPSRAGAAAAARRIGAIEDRLAAVDPGRLGPDGRVSRAVLAHLARGTREDLEAGLWEANASAGGYVSPAAMMFQAISAAPLTSARAVADYLTRLSGLGGFLDAVTRRYRQALADGRAPAQAGLRRAMAQLEGHLVRDIGADPLVTVPLPPGCDEASARAQAAAIVAGSVRPALRRLLACMDEDLLPEARPDGRVGIRFVPGGAEAYQAAVRRHTSTDLTPEQIHQIGMDTLAGLRAEWAEAGGRALGVTDVPAILSGLRTDPALRFADAGEIIATVVSALGRAEAAWPDWFPPIPVPGCVIEEIDPVQAASAPLAYYRPPAAGGLRPGAHCVLTTRPGDRFRYEYEALAFHESVPGHHLQICAARSLPLPDFRRYPGAGVSGYAEGWALYCERLADEMGLYTSDTDRLGMLSFDALRACRLVVDTGMHHYGWSRSEAVDFLWRNTATPRANVDNEIDRYIAWPGQALAYLVGRREIRRLRERSRHQLGPRFDIRGFHGAVLGSGAVPLPVLDDIVAAWAAAAAMG
jgi:uncharacterized protein (DUF885 family)